MEYYYTNPENIDEKNAVLTVSGQDSKHISRVLRKKTGDIVKITDGCRNIFTSRIVEIKKDSVLCSILEKSYNLFEPEMNMMLFAAPLRNQDRFEFLVEKAVELGVNEITPVITQNTVVKSEFSYNKTERLKKIMIHAMGQSQRCFLPRMNKAATLVDIVKMTAIFNNKIVFYEFAEQAEGFVKTDNDKDVCVLFGPEGGFEKKEIDLLVENNWQVRSLGERKLRSETAAIIGIYEII
ncbi:MAG TPA: RsmE family RNA methyltransferase, partial [Ignavibacteria bacterium]|nr:RsmE family RNA methyltransferase [Ignavibacteria bacterium]